MTSTTTLAVIGAIAFLLVPAIAILIWQHRSWRRTEQALADTEDRYGSVKAALDASPDGYFAWMPTATAEEEGVCSRRLAVLLDLYRGLDATFTDVLEGFDAQSADTLTKAVERLRQDGTGFAVELAHLTTGRRIEARGVRASSDPDAPAVDMVWMSDVTEGVAAVDALTKENVLLKETNSLLEVTLDGLTAPVWLRDDDLSLIYCNAAYVAAVDATTARDVTSRGRELAPRNAVREVRALAAAARASGVTRAAPFHMVISGSRRLLEVTENPVAPKHDEPSDDDLPESKDGSTETTGSLFGDGSGLMTAGIAYDITRQEELETRLRRETASHAEVLERLGTAIAVFAADQRLAFHNTAFAQLWDLDSTWLRDGPVYGDILEALRDKRRLPEVADFPAFKEAELNRFHSLINPLEDVMHLPDGGTLRRVIAPHPMGGLLTTYEDVTDTLALERSYNTLIAVQRETIDNLNQAVAVFSFEGQLQLANPAFLTLWGMAASAVEDQVPVAQAVEYMAAGIATDEERGTFTSLVLNAVNPDVERAFQQERFSTRDGVMLEISAVPLPDGGTLFSFSDEGPTDAS